MEALSQLACTRSSQKISPQSVPTSLPKGSTSAAIYNYDEEFSVDWKPLPDDYFDNLIETFPSYCNQNVASSIFCLGSITKVENRSTSLWNDTEEEIWRHCDKKGPSIVLQFWNLILLEVVAIVHGLGETVYCRHEKSIMGPENLTVSPVKSIMLGSLEYDNFDPFFSIVLKSYGLHELICNGTLQSGSLTRQVIISMLNGSTDSFILSDYFTNIVFMLKDNSGLEARAKEIRASNNRIWKEVETKSRRMAELEWEIMEEKFMKKKHGLSEKIAKIKKLKNDANELAQQRLAISIKISYRIFKNDDMKCPINMVLASLIHHRNNYTDDQVENVQLKTERLRGILSNNARGSYNEECTNLQSDNPHFLYIISMTVGACYRFFPDFPKISAPCERIVMKVYDPDFIQDYKKISRTGRPGSVDRRCMEAAAQKFDKEIMTYRTIFDHNLSCTSKEDIILAPKIIYHGDVILWDNNDLKFGGLAIFMTEIPKGDKVTKKSIDFGFHQLRLLSDLGIYPAYFLRKNYILTPDEKVVWVGYGKTSLLSDLETNTQRFDSIFDSEV
ncbi:hypothetical protein DASC09_030020 [Saccharomycopsis crataegensis]|uniref:Uncharacterized protein n=1 Tax=Saccharomycopsis crataegensis TaxID=43959 RepID=A0AAV5QMB5_9ASCO|nr:hypothetical protein DASC09_030020 [Saccharomycopsis crataegensis]